ncbi:RBBP9/YdeN family alpha/beta hydrolase [Nocardiopsis suaedae]|uniref:Alpha/beta hydrolase n=1 Tax=Nocardiopsis suaedae TaxID=3018444 RepID=A0ABT4TJB6_9ACTN|nr:alpha/beta hydrolase [Nocardiopsis suaedae]MDA2804691.1 alpha/beta hydrolase [Nocardiopsis suaedae]
MAPKATERRESIFHGYAATPGDHWFGWLAERLERAGIPADVPALPESGSPDPDRWGAAVAEAVGTPDQGSVVVAHSLGCLAVLRYLASLSGPWRLGTLVLVSGFVDELPALPVLDGFIGDDGADTAGVRERIGSLTLLRSDDDPYVPTGHTDRLARLLGTTATVVPGAGHFLAEDGVTALPQALEAIV